jgi:outer membrane lipoprotein-sorting protein
MNKVRRATVGTLVATLAAIGLAGCGNETNQTGPTPIVQTTPNLEEATPTVGLLDPIETIPMGTPDTGGTMEPSGTMMPGGTMEPSGTMMPGGTMEPSGTMMPGGTAQPTSGTTTNLPISGPAADVLQRAANTMRSVTSYHGVVTTEAGGVTTVAEGDFMPPDKSRLLIDSGALGKIETILIGQESYTKLPGTDTYTKITTPVNMQNNDVGSLLNFTESAEIVGDETIGGAETTHVRFVYDQDKVTAAAMEGTDQTPTSVGLGKATADMWVEKSTGYVRQYKVTTGVDPAVTTVTTVYSKFNEPVNPPIVAPTNITNP